MTADKLEEIIKPLSDYEHSMKMKYHDSSPDSTEEMKNLESRQAAVALLQIRNYDPTKYALKAEEDNHIVFNSGPSLPADERAREPMHCNAVIDIISKAVAVAQREQDDGYPANYPRDRASDMYPNAEYTDDYSYPRNELKSNSSSLDEREKEMDLSVYSAVKNEPEDREPAEAFYPRETQTETQSYQEERKTHVARKKVLKESNSAYEDCSQSSSESDPDRLQMDISQISQVGTSFHTWAFILYLIHSYSTVR